MIGLTVKGTCVKLDRINKFGEYIDEDGRRYEETEFIHIIGAKDPHSFFYDRECPKLLTVFSLEPEWKRCGLREYCCDNVVAVVSRGIVTMFETNDDRLLQYNSSTDLIYDIEGAFFDPLIDQDEYDVIRKLYKETGL